MLSPTFLSARRRLTTLIVGVACATAATACSSDTEKPADSQQSPSQQSSAIQPQSLTQEQQRQEQKQQEQKQQNTPPAETNARPKTQKPGEPGKLVPTSVRVGSHNGFDRVVVELQGEGTPGWYADYSKSPTQQASGKPLNVAGQSFLNLNIDGTTYPFEQSVEQNLGPTKGTGPVVAEVVSGGTFEGRSQFLIGVNGENLPYSVSTLENPTRVVIDIKQH